ncbi:MAG TPA: hypothetical protein VL403_03185 [Candidatus Kryptonia bacterium]|nr:hypothetical protein [Candidatus Kryptonia bacterium]
MDLRGHARRRRRVPWVAWLGSLAALAIAGWLLWRSFQAKPRSAAIAPVGEEEPEVTQEERRGLDDVLRTKQAEHGH